MTTPITDDKWLEQRRAEYEQRVREIELSRTPEAIIGRARDLVRDYDDYNLDHEDGVYVEIIRDLLGMLKK